MSSGTTSRTKPEDFIKVAQESKVVTEVTVNATAVESMTDDTAVVLVVGHARASPTPQAPNRSRAPGGCSVDLKRDGDQIKMSKVEFVP